ncbi:MAG: hypothetical protein H6843_10055 [Rhodospirillaceae bacterium]|nr:hypothetical protein [Rhodospirillaceae bacterium]
MQRTYPFAIRKRMTRLGEAVARHIADDSCPIISNYDLFRIVWHIYSDRRIKYLRDARPTKEAFSRLRSLLQEENIIFRDADFYLFWRISGKSDVPADEAACIADKFCYISHISAMQRYGLTDRRPRELFITRPTLGEYKRLLQEKFVTDYGDAIGDSSIYIEPPRPVHYPQTVRGRPLSVLSTVCHGDWRPVRGTFAKVGTIGQTFLDMLEAPDRCGGMAHVLTVWQEHALTYVEEIIASVDQAPKPIHKVRAGHILEERLGVNDTRVVSWKKHVMRGGSRVLDPQRPFTDTYSEEWMISLNAD